MTPVERAGKAIADLLADGNDWSLEALAAFKSIDVEGIAKAIHDGPEAQFQYVKMGVALHSWAECTYQEQYLNDARAVKGWLTGKESL